MKYCITLSLLSTFAAVVIGCTPVQQNSPRASAEPTPAIAPESSAATTAPLQPPEPPLPAQRHLADDVRQLLADAEYALSAEHLTTPEDNNAFDRFRAVLLLDPGNEQALSGLQAILTRYLTLTQLEIDRNQLSKARALLERARYVDKSSPQIAALQQAINAKQAKVVAANPTPVVEKDGEILLDPNALTQKHVALVGQLQSLATKLRETDESVLIVARNDAEGRWIYKQMAEAVMGYRLRGDIRLGKAPKIILQPPIE